MRPRWLLGMDEEEAERFTTEYKSAALFRERLSTLLQEDVNKSLKEMREAARGGNVLELSAYYADELSKQRTLEEVLKLIK